MSANHNLAQPEPYEAYTQLLDDLEIKTSKRAEFLELVQNFLARNQFDLTASETYFGAPVDILVHRFIHVWGGAIWGASEFSEVEPASRWTPECQKLTKRV